MNQKLEDLLDFIRIPWRTFRWFLFKKRNKLSKHYLHKFQPGDVVVWAGEEVFGESWVSKQSTSDMQKWYGSLGYGKSEKPLFVFLCHINGCDESEGYRYNSGHCCILELATGRLEWMRHTDEFRFATDEEF